MIDKRFSSEAGELEKLEQLEEPTQKKTPERTPPRAIIPSETVGPFSSASPYHNVSQGTPIHGLIASSTSPQNMQIQMNLATRAGAPQPVQEGTIKSDGVIITVDEEALDSISPQTFKVLIMYLSKATEQLPRGDQITPEAILRGRVISLTLEDYMRACRVRDKKSARDQLNTAVSALFGISLEWDEIEYNKPEGKSRKVRIRVHHKMRITDHTITREEGNPVKRGAAEIRLSYDMAEYLSGAYIMPYPSALLTINTHKNPYSIPLGWKLCALDNMNITNNHPNRVGRTKVETLLRAAKGIPRYDVIAEKGQVFDRIIGPFDRDMRELVRAGVLTYYHYYDSNGREVSSIAALSYSDFSALNVRYEIKGYPNQAPRIEAKQKRISAAINRNKKAAAKRKAEAAPQDSAGENG